MKDRILQRGCRENHREGFTRADGEAGKGIYFFVPSASMRNYYTGNNEELVTIKIKPSAKIMDFTETMNLMQLMAYAESYFNKIADSMGSGYKKPKVLKSNYQRYGQMIESFIREIKPDLDGYIVNHQGVGIPKGKQAIIINEDCFSIVYQKTKEIGMSY